MPSFRFFLSFSCFIVFKCFGWLSNYDLHLICSWLRPLPLPFSSHYPLAGLYPITLIPSPLYLFSSVQCLALFALLSTVYPSSVSTRTFSVLFSLYIHFRSFCLFKASSLFLPYSRLTLSSSLFLSPSIWCSHLPFYFPFMYLISICLRPPLSLTHTATQRRLCKPRDHFLPINLGGLTAMPELTVE